jgi:hypothetical protein
VSSHGETARTRIGDTLARRRAAWRSGHRIYGEALVARLVMSLADLRLKRRAEERARRHASSSV